MLKDNCSEFEVRRAISPTRATNNTALVSEVIDMGTRHSLTFFIAAGTLADADATFTTLVEDSADGSTFAAVVDEHLIGTEAAASFDYGDDDTVYKIGYVGPKRYVRLTITPANNTGNADISAVAVLGGAKKL